MVVDKPHVYDLAPAVQRCPVVLTERHRRSSAIPFRITPRLHERYPYIHLVFRFRIVFAARSGRGTAYVNMLTGSGSSAQAEFLAARRHGRFHLAWDIVSVAGERAYRSTRRAARVTYPNYMLFADAAPGRHTIRFRLERYAGLHVERVVVSCRTTVRPTRHVPLPARPVAPPALFSFGSAR